VSQPSRAPVRAGIAAVAALALIGLFVVLRPGSGPAAPSPSPTPPGSPSPRTTTPGSPGPTASPTPDVREVDIEVEEGRVQGPSVVRLALGERVRLEVQADRADEVHVHGYDLLEDVAPGSPARIVFTADAPGVFEVELEGSGLLLTRLEVAP
jgi:hypothetical protein